MRGCYKLSCGHQIELLFYSEHNRLKRVLEKIITLTTFNRENKPIKINGKKYFAGTVDCDNKNCQNQFCLNGKTYCHNQEELQEIYLQEELIQEIEIDYWHFGKSQEEILNQSNRVATNKSLNRVSKYKED